LGITS